jgi:hypothetical protein
MPATWQVLDPIRVSFDDERAVVDAGLMLTGTLIGRLGLEAAIDDIGLLHAGSTGKVLGHDTVAASTAGSWLRSLTFGHIRQLDAVTEAALTRAWQAGAGPGDTPMFIVGMAA